MYLYAEYITGIKQSMYWYEVGIKGDLCDFFVGSLVFPRVVFPKGFSHDPVGTLHLLTDGDCFSSGGLAHVPT